MKTVLYKLYIYIYYTQFYEIRKENTHKLWKKYFFSPQPLTFFEKYATINLLK